MRGRFTSTSYVHSPPPVAHWLLAWIVVTISAPIITDRPLLNPNATVAELLHRVRAKSSTVFRVSSTARLHVRRQAIPPVASDIGDAHRSAGSNCRSMSATASACPTSTIPQVDSTSRLLLSRRSTETRNPHGSQAAPVHTAKRPPGQRKSCNPFSRIRASGLRTGQQQSWPQRHRQEGG